MSSLPVSAFFPATSHDPLLIFIDIDGTLITHSQELPRSAERACKAAVAQGHLLYLCTGRSLPEVYERLWDLGFSGIIAGAGAHVISRGTTLADIRMTQEQIDGLDAFLKSAGALYIWQGSEAMHPSAGFLDFFWESMQKAGLPGWREYVEGVSRFSRPGIPQSITKCTAYLPVSTISFNEVVAALPFGVKALPGSIGSNGFMAIEFMPEQVSKGAAIELLARHLQFPMERTVALGDSHNDIEALQVAGCGVAMGNAPEDVKKVADYVTSDVNADGLRNAFVTLGVTPTVDL